jgi:hypothetical protein
VQPHQQQQAPQGDVDPFAPIPATGGSGLPGARHLEGRVIIVKPIRVDETTLGFDKKTPAPTLIADIIVVDGGPLVYGDQVNNAGQQLKPPTHRIETPCMFRGWLDSHPFIVGPCRDMLRAGQPVTVGIIERGTQGNRPYFLVETHTDVDRKPRTDPSFAARRTNAINLFNAFQTGQWKSPEPVELNPQPAAAPAVAQPWGGLSAQQFTQNAQAFNQPAQAPAQGWGAQPAAAAPLAGQQAWQATASAQAPAPVAPAGPAMRDLSQPAPGFEGFWSTFTETQKMQIWQAQPQAQQQPAPAVNAAPW